MKSRVFIISLLIFCLVLANFVSVNTSSELEEDPLVPGWSKDVRISNASGDSLHPSIAVDSKGWIHIVWQDARTGEYWQIYYARSKDGGNTWEEKPIAGNATTGGKTPCIIVDQSDTLHVVWSASWDGTVTGLEIYYKNSSDSGDTWGGDKRLTYASGESHAPRIAAHENTLHVVWSDKRDGNFEIYYKRSTDGGNSWGEDVRLTNDEGPSKLPTILIDLIGQVHVAWYDKREDMYKIYYKHSSDGGITWSNETNISEGHGTTTLLASPPSICINSHNDIYIFWQDGPFGSEDIFFRVKKSNNLWDQEKKIVDTLEESLHPFTVVDSDNNIHMVWDDGRTGCLQIYYMCIDREGSVGQEVRITNTSTTSWHPKVAIDSGGLLHIVWMDERDGNKEIYYKRTLNPVTEPPIVVTQTLNVSTCKPGNSVTVSGNAKWNNTPAINASVCVKIIEIGALWTTTTDSNGDYNITITAPSTPGNYTIRTTVSFDNRIGTKYAKLTVESEGVVDGGVTNGRQQEGLNIIYLAIIGAVAGGIIVAFALLRMRKTKVPKVEKPKEEQKLDIEFPSKIQTMTLRCPECRMTFSIEVKPKPFGVKCPNCGREGEIK